MTMTSRTARTSRTALASRVALAAVAALGTSALLAACGSAAAPSSSAAGLSSSAAGTNSTTTTARVSLDVTFAATPTRPAIHYTLRCEPAGGTTPDPAAACTKLLAGENILTSRPLHVMCPMVLQTGARATITGTYLGRPVHVTIVNGGCDLGRWSKLKSIFG